jgi:hypothetical protein
VGGDVWGHADALGMGEPVEPLFKPPEYAGADSPVTLAAPPEDYEAALPAPEPTLLPDDASDALVAATQVHDEAQALAHQRYLEDRDKRIAEYGEYAKAHAAATQRFEADRAAFEAEVLAAQAKFEAEEMASHRDALAKFQVAHDAARQAVDRIAFAGQVPVNVLGAKPGDYIVPTQEGDGIKGISVAKPTFDQYRAAVGRVIAIEADGRARVIVKVA